MSNPLGLPSFLKDGIYIYIYTIHETKQKCSTFMKYSMNAPYLTNNNVNSLGSILDYFAFFLGLGFGILVLTARPEAVEGTLTVRVWVWWVW